MKRRLMLVTLLVVVVAAVAVAVIVDPFRSVAAPSDGESPSTAPLQTTEVTRTDLTTDKEFTATVSYDESWSLPLDAAGIVTDSRDEGEVVDFGDELVRLDDKPVFLARGDMPLYRELRKVDTSKKDENGNKQKLQTGDDVTQLQQFLLDAGYDDDGQLTADGTFGKITRAAVKDWQKDVGLPVTGKVDRSQIVFAPDPVRITKADRVGNPFSELQVGPTEAVVKVDTNTSDRGHLPEGQGVVVRLPETNETLDGEVVKQEETQDEQGSTLWTTTIATDTAIDPSRTATSAEVTVTRTLAEDVLTVPVGALLALAEGGYAVETVDDNDSSTLVKVELGEVVDGIAEITGDLDEGDQVVVPE